MEKEVRDLCARNGAYDYLLKYKNTIDLQDNWNASPKRKVIWTCWWQGVSSAPPIVQKCINSMSKYANGFEVIVIDNNNVSNFIQLPAFVVEKHDKGIIPHAHFSDILRVALLEKYGGIWIDSTILLTSNLPEYIVNADLFLFRGSGLAHTPIYNPFIAANPNHPIIEAVFQLLLEYWKHENKLVSYSIFHLFFEMAINASPFYKDLWNLVPNVSGTQMFYLQSNLGKDFDKSMFDLATAISPVHKLTYKYNDVNLDIEKPETLYQYILESF